MDQRPLCWNGVGLWSIQDVSNPAAPQSFVCNLVSVFLSVHRKKKKKSKSREPGGEASATAPKDKNRGPVKVGPLGPGGRGGVRNCSFNNIK